MTFNEVYDMFFGKDLTWYACVMRIFLSFLAGGLLGLERQFRQQFVGMRTLVLICVSSTLLMLVSIYVATDLAPVGRGDPARIAAQVVSGVGFLGAGTILRQGLNIKGLTSSAIIWAAAALGLAIGAGFAFLAIVTLIIFMLALVYFEKLTERFFPAERIKHFHLVFSSNKIDIDALSKLVVASGLIIVNTDIKKTLGQKHIVITFFVHVPPSIDIFELADKIKHFARLEEFSLTD